MEEGTNEGAEESEGRRIRKGRKEVSRRKRKQKKDGVEGRGIRRLTGTRKLRQHNFRKSMERNGKKKDE